MDPDDKLTRVQLVKDLIQQAVDKGATSVEQIHQYIASLPFETLERVGLLDEDKLQLREKQRRTIGMVYDAIRRINKMVGDLISDQIENLEDGKYVAQVLEERKRKQQSE
jgi:nucleotidyltransferase/DNA polymerase involved in DNA repair